MIQSEPRKQGGRSTVRRLAPLFLAVGVLFGAVSAIGTSVALGLVSVPAAQTTAAPGQPGGAPLVSLTESEAIIRVAKLAEPSVVTIVANGISGVTPFSVPASGAGSGFIVSADGLILTNEHVVAGALSLSVTLGDGHQLAGRIVATDVAHDLAVIRVDSTGLTPVTLGDSGAVQVGQLAIAIGSPLGTFTDSVTEGIVSGLDRTITVGSETDGTSRFLMGLIQTDAAINPGNSGGPLFDAAGSVVGIITAGATDGQDVGFAVPIDQARQLIAQAAP